MLNVRTLLGPTALTGSRGVAVRPQTIYEAGDRSGDIMLVDMPRPSQIKTCKQMEEVIHPGPLESCRHGDVALRSPQECHAHQSAVTCSALVNIRSRRVIGRIDYLRLWCRYSS